MGADTELDALLSERPDVDVFRAVCALLERLPAGKAEGEIARAEDAMASWPLRARTAPWSWSQALMAGYTKGTWRLARGLETQPPCLGKAATPFAAIADRPELSRLARFDLVGYDGEVDAFAAHAHRWQPRSLRIRHDWGGRVAALRSLALFDALEELHVGSLHDDTFHHPPTSFVPAIAAAPSLRAVTLRADDLVALWDRARLPALRDVRVWVLDADQAGALARRPELERIERLSIAFRCGYDGRTSFEPSLGHAIEASDEAAERFFAEARLDQLRDLRLIGRSSGYWTREGPGPRTLDALVRSGVLAKLRRLRLELLPLGDAGLARVVENLPAGLRELELVDVYAKNATAVALASQSFTAGLERLVLRANRIRSAGHAALAGVPFARLRELDLSGPDCEPYYFRLGEQPLRDEGLEAWSRSSAMSTLRILNVAGARLTDAALIALCKSPDLQLEELDFAHNQATADGMRALTRLPSWKSLRALSLRDCLLDDRALAALTDAGEAPRLRALDLAFNAIGADGAGRLAAWPVLAGLRRLDLHDNAIGDDGLAALARSTHVLRLLELDLQQDCWNQQRMRFQSGGQALAASSAFRDLDTIHAGIVDAYHQCAYTSGFTSDVLDALRLAPAFRPEVRASLASDALSLDGDDADLRPPATEVERELVRRHDFRNHPRSTDDDPEHDPEPSGPSLRQMPHDGS